jgi:hypothetical protein
MAWAGVMVDEYTGKGGGCQGGVTDLLMSHIRRWVGGDIILVHVVHPSECHLSMVETGWYQGIREDGRILCNNQLDFLLITYLYGNCVNKLLNIPPG